MDSIFSAAFNRVKSEVKDDKPITSYVLNRLASIHSALVYPPDNEYIKWERLSIGNTELQIPRNTRGLYQSELFRLTLTKLKGKVIVNCNIPLFNFSSAYWTKCYVHNMTVWRGISVNSLFDKVVWNQCDFRYADLSDSFFYQNKFTRCSFLSTDLERAEFGECVFTECVISEVLTPRTKFMNCEFIRCRFENVGPFMVSLSNTAGVLVYDCHSISTSSPCSSKISTLEALESLIPRTRMTKAEVPSSKSSMQLEFLPDDVLISIADFLPRHDFLAFLSVSHGIRKSILSNFPDYRIIDEWIKLTKTFLRSSLDPHEMILLVASFEHYFEHLQLIDHLRISKAPLTEQSSFLQNPRILLYHRVFFGLEDRCIFMLVKSKLASVVLDNSHSSPDDSVVFFYIIQSEQSDRPWLMLYLWSPSAPLCTQLDMTPDSPRLLLALHFAHNSLESQPLLSTDIPFGYDEPLLHSFSSLLRHHSALTLDMGTSEMNSNHMGLVNVVLRYLDETFNTDMTMVLVPFQSRGQIPPLDSAHYDLAILRHLEPDMSPSLRNFLSSHKNYFLSCPELEWHNLCQTMATSFHSLCFEITGKRPDLTERDPSVAAFVNWISENLVIRNVGRYKKVHGYDDNEILDLDATISPSSNRVQLFTKDELNGSNIQFSELTNPYFRPNIFHQTAEQVKIHKPTLNHLFKPFAPLTCASSSDRANSDRSSSQISVGEPSRSRIYLELVQTLCELVANIQPWRIDIDMLSGLKKVTLEKYTGSVDTRERSFAGGEDLAANENEPDVWLMNEIFD